MSEEQRIARAHQNIDALLDGDQREADPLNALAAARVLLAEIDLEISSAVRMAHRDGWTWADIGQCLGISRQAVQQRFGPLL
jgi:DNA-directed RNA polymerase specialized sigma24 family protein